MKDDVRPAQKNLLVEIRHHCLAGGKAISLAVGICRCAVAQSAASGGRPRITVSRPCRRGDGQPADRRITDRWGRRPSAQKCPVLPRFLRDGVTTGAGTPRGAGSSRAPAGPTASAGLPAGSTKGSGTRRRTRTFIPQRPVSSRASRRGTPRDDARSGPANGRRKERAPLGRHLERALARPGPVRTPARPELRLRTEGELSHRADVAARGVHRPGRMSFLTPWTDL